MELLIHYRNAIPIAELQSDAIEIENVQDALDLIGNSDHRGARKIIVKKEQFCPEFFDLKTGVAGETLQKFSTYRMQLAIIGDFSEHQSKSFKDFIYESNKTGRIIFVTTLNEALERLSK